MAGSFLIYLNPNPTSNKSAGWRPNSFMLVVFNVSKNWVHRFTWFFRIRVKRSRISPELVRGLDFEVRLKGC